MDVSSSLALTAIVVSIFALGVAWWSAKRTISLQKQMRDLQKNPSELAGIQLKQILEAKRKTILNVTYRRGENRIGTFTIRNTGSTDARNIKLQIDTPESKFSHVSHREFLTEDGITFALPDLRPSQFHDVSINWDSSESRADVLWSWVNADDSGDSGRHTIDRWS